MLWMAWLGQGMGTFSVFEDVCVELKILTFRVTYFRGFFFVLREVFYYCVF